MDLAVKCFPWDSIAEPLNLSPTHPVLQVQAQIDNYCDEMIRSARFLRKYG